MNTERDVERIVRSWLDEGVNALPDRVLDAVLDQLPTTPQRRAGWLARRFPIMNSPIARFGFAALAVVAIAIIGYSLLRGPNGVGPPAATPTPTPDVPAVSLDATDLGVPLSGGRYAFEIGPAPETHFSVELAMEAGWVPQQLAVSQVAFAGPNTNGASLGFYSILRVYRDPCHPEAGYAGSYLGTSNSHDLVNELGALAGFDAGPLSTLQIGDLTATHFVISNTIDTEAAGCTDGQLLPLFMTRDADRGAELRTRTNDSPATNGGTSQEVWIVDRAGWALAIIGEVGGTSPEEDRAALEEIIGSITLPTPVPFSATPITGALDPGAIVLDGPFPLAIAFDVPAGWTRAGSAELADSVGIAKMRGGSTPAWSSWAIVANVYADPCHALSGPMDPRSVQALTTSSRP